MNQYLEQVIQSFDINALYKFVDFDTITNVVKSAFVAYIITRNFFTIEQINKNTEALLLSSTEEEHKEHEKKGIMVINTISYGRNGYQRKRAVVIDAQELFYPKHELNFDIDDYCSINSRNCNVITESELTLDENNVYKVNIENATYDEERANLVRFIKINDVVLEELQYTFISTKQLSIQTCGYRKFDIRVQKLVFR